MFCRFNDPEVMASLRFSPILQMLNFSDQMPYAATPRIPLVRFIRCHPKKGCCFEGLRLFLGEVIHFFRHLFNRRRKRIAILIAHVPPCTS